MNVANVCNNHHHSLRNSYMCIYGSKQRHQYWILHTDSVIIMSFFCDREKKTLTEYFLV